MFSQRQMSASILAAVIFTGCTERMRLKMDAAWEAVDPMGHRSEHQMRYYPRGYIPGMRLPEGSEVWKPAPLPGSSRKP